MYRFLSHKSSHSKTDETSPVPLSRKSWTWVPRGVTQRNTLKENEEKITSEKTANGEISFPNYKSFTSFKSWGNQHKEQRTFLDLKFSSLWEAVSSFPPAPWIQPTPSYLRPIAVICLNVVSLRNAPPKNSNSDLDSPHLPNSSFQCPVHSWAATHCTPKTIHSFLVLVYQLYTLLESSMKTLK